MSLTDLLTVGVQQHTESANFYREQGESIEQAKLDMVSEASQQRESLEQNAAQFEATAAANIAASMDARGGLVPWMTTTGKIDWYFGIPKFQIDDLRPDGTLGTGTHPAFVLNDGQEADMLWYSAYALSLNDGEVVSQPNQQPYTGRTQSEEIALCAASEIAAVGPKRVSSIWDESAITLWLEKMVNDGSMDEPAGNTAYGAYHSNTALKGHGASWIKTGSMGAMANHNGESHGIADFIGNVWTRCNGMYLQDGEIFLAANNDQLSIASPLSTGYYYSAGTDDFSANGTPSIVDNSVNVLRNGAVGDNSNNANSSISGSAGFAALSGPSSALIRLAGVAPHGDGTDLSGALWLRNYGTRAPLLRGSWSIGSSAGPRALHLFGAPSLRYSRIGFRSAFVTSVS